MEIDRRSLMKGMLASGALMAVGVPSWAFADPPRSPRLCVLLLGGTSADGLFENGARAAGADITDKGLQTVNLRDGLLSGTDRVVQLLEQFRGSRWIAIMDDASAVIFLELARTAGVRLLSMGTHICSADSVCPLRHAWTTTSAAYGVGGLLASQFADNQGGFSIKEDFLHAPLETGTLVGWSAPGFSSYQLAEPESVHLHSSRLPLADGCRLIGHTSIEGWEPLPPHVCRRETVRRKSGNWVESVGYAVTVSALGVSSVRESCMSRAFVRQSSDGTRSQPTERFVSFVMDI